MAFEQKFLIPSEAVDPSGHLRLSELLMLAQKMATAHVEALGYPIASTRGRNLFWVVARQRFLIDAIPSFPDEILFRTHPGEGRAYVYPRHYEILSNGKIIIRGVSAWVLIDGISRKIVTPKEANVIIPGEEYEGDLPFPSGIRAPELPQVAKKKADWSLCDINGHLNNTKYLDLCEDLIPEDFLMSHRAKEIVCEYKKEIHLGEEFEVHYGKIGDSYWFASDRFLFRIDY